MFKISFIKMKKKEISLIFIILLVVSIGFIASNTFETKTILLKFSLNKGDSINKNINIFSKDGGEIKLYVKGIKKGVSIKENSFILNKGEERQVEVLFNSSSINEGVYVGNIEITGDGEKQIIPIIFEVESKDVFFDANLDIPAKYLDILQGDKIIAQLNVFDLISGGGTQESLGPSSIDVEYKINDLYGNVLSSENENFVVDNKLQMTKTITFPKDIKTGQYVFSVIIKYKSSVGTTTDLFRISKEKSKSSTNLFNKDKSEFIFTLIFIGFIFLVLILFFIYIIRDRDKLFLELRKYNTQELQRQKSLLTEQANLVKKKKGNIKNIEKEVSQKINKIKEKQKKRVEEFRKLKNKGEIQGMKKKLNEWKKKGYGTMALEYKLKDLSVDEMKNIINKWKKKYNFK